MWNTVIVVVVVVVMGMMVVLVLVMVLVVVVVDHPHAGFHPHELVQPLNGALARHWDRAARVPQQLVAVALVLVEELELLQALVQAPLAKVHHFVEIRRRLLHR
jgi:hypothetical protein